MEACVPYGVVRCVCWFGHGYWVLCSQQGGMHRGVAVCLVMTWSRADCRVCGVHARLQALTFDHCYIFEVLNFDHYYCIFGAEGRLQALRFDHCYTFGGEVLSFDHCCIFGAEGPSQCSGVP
jgi:hypothetical protein